MAEGKDKQEKQTGKTATMASLINSPVVVFSAGERVGTIGDVFIDAAGKAVTHIEILFTREGSIPRIVDYGKVKRVGRDLVFVEQLPKPITDQGKSMEDKAEADRPREKLPDDLLGIDSLRLLDVLSHDARNLGSVRDAVFDAASGEVLYFIVSAGRVQDFVQGEVHIPREAVNVFGRDCLILTEDALDKLKQGKPGMRDTVDDVRQTLESLLDDTLTQGRSLLERVQRRVADSDYRPEELLGNVSGLRSRLADTRERLVEAWADWRSKAQSARDDAEELVAEREAAVVVGTVAGRTVTAEDDEIEIVKKGEVITESTVEKAREHNRLYPLFLSAAITEVSEQLEELQETASELGEQTDSST